MSRNLGEAVISLTVNTGKAFKGLDQMQNRMLAISSGVQSGGRAISRFGQVVTGVAAAVGIKSIKSYADYELAMKSVQKTTDLTSKEIEELSDNFSKLSESVPISPEELAAVAEIAGTLGIKGVKDLEKFALTVNKVAVATNLTKEAAATSFARYLQLSKEPVENVERLASAMVKLGNNTAANEAQINEVSREIIKFTADAGMATDATLALAATFAEAGSQPQQARGGIQKMIKVMTDAYSKGGEKLKEISGVMGMDTKEAADLIENDMLGAFKALLKGYNRLDKKQQFLFLEKVKLDSIQANIAMNVLSRNFDRLERNIEMARKEYEKYAKGRGKDSELNKEASIFFSALAMKLKLVGTQLNEVFKEIGDAIMEAGFREFLNEVTRVLIKVKQWVKANPELVAQILKIATIIGVAATAVGALVIAVGSLIGAIGVGALGAGFLATLGPALAVMLPLLLKAAAAFAVAIPFIIEFGKQLWESRKAIEGWFTDLDLMDDLKEIFNDLKTLFKEGFRVVQRIVSGFLEGFVVGFDGAGKVIKDIVENIKVFIKNLLGIFGEEEGDPTEEWKFSWEDFGRVVGIVIGSVLKNLLKLIKGFTDLALLIQNTFDDIKTFISDTFDDVLEEWLGFEEESRTIWTLIGLTIEGVVIKSAKRTAEAYKKLWKSMMKGLDAIHAYWEETFTDLGVGQYLVDVEEGFNIWAQEIKVLFKAMGKDIEDTLTRTGKRFGTWLSLLPRRVEIFTSNLRAKLFLGLTKIPNDMYEAGKDMIQKLMDGMREVMTNLKNWFKGAIGVIAEGIKGLWNKIREVAGAGAEVNVMKNVQEQAGQGAGEAKGKVAGNNMGGIQGNGGNGGVETLNDNRKVSIVVQNEIDVAKLKREIIQTVGRV